MIQDCDKWHKGNKQGNGINKGRGGWRQGTRDPYIRLRK